MMILSTSSRRGREEIERRIASPRPDDSLAELVRSILKDVDARGDVALIDYTARFDGITLNRRSIRMKRRDLSAAAAGTPKADKAAIDLAWERILSFHEYFLDETELMDDGGTIMGLLVRPMDRIGIYMPGGRGGATPLFSTLLMAAGAARAAGVPKIAVTTPPGKGGRIPPHLAYSAMKAGITEIHRVGGAQAIAALAFGTETIDPVSKIVGPGNRYVTEAKRQVFGIVGIESIAGPSEVVILADGRADAAFIAADLVAQAEHSPDARAFALSPSGPLLRAVMKALRRVAKDNPRRKTIERSLRDNGALIRTRSLTEAVEITNRIAPEHLEIMTASPWDIASGVKAAGAIFMGPYTPETIGDYVAGPNHILPTAGTARFLSALSARDFLSVSTVLDIPRENLPSLARAAARMALKENLPGHAAAALSRLERKGRRGKGR